MCSPLAEAVSAVAGDARESGAGGSWVHRLQHVSLLWYPVDALNLDCDDCCWSSDVVGSQSFRYVASYESGLRFVWPDLVYRGL